MCSAVAGENLAWIATGGSRARVFYTTDGGQQWSVAPTPVISGTPSTGIFSIAFLNGEQGIAVGGDYADPTLIKDNIATTADGGRSWRLVRNHQIAYRSCGREVDGWYVACGPTGTDISYDLGRSWQRVDTAGYHVISVGDSREAIWAAGAEGKVRKSGGSEIKSEACPPKLGRVGNPRLQAFGGQGKSE